MKDATIVKRKVTMQDAVVKEETKGNMKQTKIPPLSVENTLSIMLGTIPKAMGKSIILVIYPSVTSIMMDLKQ